MHDPKSEPREFLGDDVAEATAKACSYFGLDAGALVVREAKEVSGLGGRTLVVARPLDSHQQSRSRGSEPRAREESRGGRDGGRERGGRDRGGRDRGGRDRDRGGRGDRGGRERGGRDFGGREPERARDDAPAEPAAEPEGPSIGTARGELGAVGDYVKGLIERMGLGSFDIERVEQEGVEVFRVEGAAAAGLTGGDGRTPDAIQLLANQVSARSGDDAPRVVIDVAGNHEKREAFLFRVAERAAARARETGRTVALDPMGPRDRRSIHVALRDATDVATMSVGEGSYRQVMVVPEGAPEFEEARSGSESPGS
jgi:predicted RNA-binding protein Jag